MSQTAVDRAIFEKIMFLTTFKFCCTLNSFSIKSYIQKTEGEQPAAAGPDGPALGDPVTKKGSFFFLRVIRPAPASAGDSNTRDMLK